MEALVALLHRTAAAVAEGADGAALAAPAFAEALDGQDPLARLRGDFLLPPTEPGAVHRRRAIGAPSVYLCGNSLGLQSTESRDEVGMEMAKWGQYGVEGHFKTDTPWVAADESVRGSMSAVVGALPSEVVVMGTLTGNLHAFMVPFYRPELGAAEPADRAPRTKILIEGKAFPSDYHAVASQVSSHGLDPKIHVVHARAGDADKYGASPSSSSSQSSSAGTGVGAATATPREDEDEERGEAGLPPSTDDVIAAIRAHGPTLSLVLLGGLQYYTGQFYDAERVIKAAKEAGAKIGLDLAHAAGNVPLVSSLQCNVMPCDAMQCDAQPIGVRITAPRVVTMSMSMSMSMSILCSFLSASSSS